MKCKPTTHSPASAEATSGAQALALNLLAFLASDQDRLARFLALTGLAPETIRARIDSPTFHAGLLDYALADESLLLTFTADQNVAPEQVVQARRLLPGGAAS